MSVCYRVKENSLTFINEEIHFPRTLTCFEFNYFLFYQAYLYFLILVSAIPENNKTIDHSSVHRELFHYLESDDISLNTLVVQRLRGYLLDEQLSSEILLPKFVQALQIIFRNSQKFAAVPLDEWAILIAKNRGKVKLIFGVVLYKILSLLFALDIFK